MYPVLMNEEPLKIEMKYVIKPWWKRFTVALEIAIFGSALIEGEIHDLKEM